MSSSILFARMGDYAELVPIWILPLLIFIVARWTMLYGRVQWERRTRGATIYTATLVAFFCGMLIVLYFASVFFGWSDDDFSRNAISIFGLPILFGGVFGWPAIIVLDDWGITARYLMRPTKRINYSEIRNLCRKSDWEFYVYGTGKVKVITLSTAHADTSEFERELRRRGEPWYTGEKESMGRLLWESANDDDYSPP